MSLTDQLVPLDLLEQEFGVFLTADGGMNENVLTRAARHILNLRDDWGLNNTTETMARSPFDLGKYHAMQLIVDRSKADLIQDIVSTLREVDAWSSDFDPDMQSENTDLAHDINEIGSLVGPPPSTGTSLPPDEQDQNDPCHRCAICKETYHPVDHPAFRTILCAHTFGQACLQEWLNSSSPAANTCPMCRAELAEPRDLDEVSMAHSRLLREQLERLTRALMLLRDLDGLVADCFAWEVEGELLTEAMEEVNWGLFEEGLGFGFVRDILDPLGWCMRRVDWGVSE